MWMLRCWSDFTELWRTRTSYFIWTFGGSSNLLEAYRMGKFLVYPAIDRDKVSQYQMNTINYLVDKLNNGVSFIIKLLFISLLPWKQMTIQIISFVFEL